VEGGREGEREEEQAIGRLTNLFTGGLTLSRTANTLFKLLAIP
jgi:hypothetical protein